MKFVFRVLAAIAAFAIGGTAYAAQYPDKPVKIIVPFAAGGPTDTMARVLAQKLGESLGQQFFVENHPGAGGNIGMGVAAKAPGDGYTLIVVSSSFVVNPSLYNKIPYDPEKDFVPITKAAAAPNALLVNPNVPAKTVKELVDLIHKEPTKFSVASPGTGTTPSLSIELFKLTFKLKDLTVVPFQGGSPAVQSTVAGHTPLSFQAIPPATPLVKAGKLRALAVTSKKRSSALPDVPTFDELGIKGQEAETMQGVLAPAGTPKEIVDLLQKQIARALALPDVKAKLLSLGFEPEGTSSAAFAAYIKDEIAKWKRVITEAKIQRI